MPGLHRWVRGGGGGGGWREEALLVYLGVGPWRVPGGTWTCEMWRGRRHWLTILNSSPAGGEKGFRVVCSSPAGSWQCGLQCRPPPLPTHPPRMMTCIPPPPHPCPCPFPLLSCFSGAGHCDGHCPCDAAPALPGDHTRGSQGVQHTPTGWGGGGSGSRGGKGCRSSFLGSRGCRSSI